MGIEPTTFGYRGQPSNQLSHTSQGTMHSFLLLSNILLSAWTTTCLFVRVFMDTWTVSSLRLVQISCSKCLPAKSLCEHMLWLLLGRCRGAGLPGHRVGEYLRCEKTAVFPRVSVAFFILTSNVIVVASSSCLCSLWSDLLIFVLLLSMWP